MANLFAMAFENAQRTAEYKKTLLELEKYRLQKAREEEALKEAPMSPALESVYRSAFPQVMADRATYETGRRGEVSGAENFDFVSSPESAYTPSGMERPVIRTPLAPISTRQGLSDLGAAQGTLGVLARQDQQTEHQQTLKALEEFLPKLEKVDPDSASRLGTLLKSGNISPPIAKGLANILLSPKASGEPEVRSFPGVGKVVGTTDTSGNFKPILTKTEQEPQRPSWQIFYNPDTRQSMLIDVNSPDLNTKPIPEGYAKGGPGAAKSLEAWVHPDRPMEFKMAQPGEDLTAQGYFRQKDVMGKGPTVRHVAPDGTVTEVASAAPQMGKFWWNTEKSRPLPGEAMERIVQAGAIYQDVQELKNTIKKTGQLPTGPITGRLNKLLSKVEPMPEFAKFDAMTSRLFTVVYFLSGKQINDTEIDLFMNKILPQIQQPGGNYVAKLDLLGDWIKRNVDIRLQTYEAAGFTFDKSKLKWLDQQGQNIDMSDFMNWKKKRQGK